MNTTLIKSAPEKALDGKYAGLTGHELVTACLADEMGIAPTEVKAAADPRLAGLTGQALLQAALQAEMDAS